MNESVSYSCIANIEKLLKQIQAMNLFTDIFTSVVFKDEGACLHLVRQLMQNPTLNIVAFRTQDAIPMLISKSPRLDVTAEDYKGTIYEIEIQRLKELAPARRTRYYSSVDDIWHGGQTVYEVEQSLRLGTKRISYDNGLHTIYVNAEIDDGSSVAKLMQYLKTAKAGDTSQGALSQYVNYLKSPEGGREVMGEFEKYVTEQTEAKVHKETALEMLKDKKPLHEIVKYSKLAKDVVLQLAKENGLEVVIG